MPIFGYVRVSTKNQKLDRQITNIKAVYPDAKIFSEHFTGTTSKRPQWEKLKSVLKADDTVIFDSVSRMSRNAEEGFADYEQLYDKGVQLVFLKEPHINTETYKKALASKVNLTGDKVDLILDGVNKYLMSLAKEQIQIAFEQSEKEVTDLHTRISEGMRESSRKGTTIGLTKGTKLTTNKSIESKKAIKSHSHAFGGTLNDAEMMKLCGISRNTYYKYKRELYEEI